VHLRAYRTGTSRCATLGHVTTDPHDEPERGRSSSSRVWSADDLVLRRVAIARGAVVLVGMVVVLAWPDRNSATTATILGGVMIAIGATSYFTGRTFEVERNESHRTVLARSALLLIAGLVLILWPNVTTRFVGLLLGAALVVMGLSGIVRGRWGSGSRNLMWRGTAMTLAGVIALVIPESTVNFVLAGIALAWAADAAMALLDAPPEGSDREVPGFAAGVLGWFGRFPMDEDQRELVTAKLFYEGVIARDRIWRYGILTVLSTAIATLGIFVDSTAVVIGAMLIAPLMTPIMGTAAALVAAWPLRAIRALVTVAGGVVLAVLVAWILTGVLAGATDPILSSSQITSRVSPTFLDLLIALAAGAAGAFAVSRADIADSLPGAAIAVALVPPLSVIGITLRIGEFDDVLGAFLLFLTNLVGMILAGALVFLLAGYTPVERLRERSSEVGRSLTVVLVLLLLIALPLVITGRQLTADLVAEDEAQAVAQDWADGTDLEIVSLEVDGSTVTLVFAGDHEPTDIDDLGQEMEQALGRDVDLDVAIVPTIRLAYESSE
jgi:uncharacterized hydrophobic protein (TIGR00271 family)